MEDPVAILHALGRTSETRRPWVIEEVVDPPPPGVGPGFVYRWEARGPVFVRFHPQGGAVFGNAARSFALEYDGNRLHLRAMEGPAREIDPGAGFEADIRGLLERSLRVSGAGDWRRAMTLTSAAMELLVVALDSLVSPQTQPDSRGKSAKDNLPAGLHNWLAGNLSPTPTPESAGSALGLKPRTLTRRLVQASNLGFAGHLAAHRLLAARRMLIRTERSVAEIAGTCGFGSSEVLIRAFSATLGWTPLQFRKAWRQTIPGEGNLRPLCRFADRLPASEETGADSAEAAPWTLVIANALHEVIEIHRETAGSERVAVMERGEMIFIPRTETGSAWTARTAVSDRAFRFVMPAGHALFVAGVDP